MPRDKIADLPLIWPTTLERPHRAKIAYLDLNHFINLAKCAHGHRAFQHYRELLAAVLRAKEDGRATFPLSSVHYVEVANIEDLRRRRDVAEMMEAVTAFASLLDRPTLARLELREAIRERLRLDVSLDRYPLLGSGVLRAFGKQGGLKVWNEAGEDVTASARTKVGHEEFDRQMAKAELDLNRSVLSGVLAPEHGELPPSVEQAASELKVGIRTRLQFETDFVEMLKKPEHGEFRKERLRDAVSAREMAHEWIDALLEELHAVGASVQDVMGNEPQSARRFAEAMPSTRVAISMKTRYHRNPQRMWTMNDVHDIDAASTAVAYCDAVFSDKHVWNALTIARELEPMRTFLPRKPEQLAEWLELLP
ncbi:hypothetical protein [Nocardioides houyundeii]|uniref:hypothetical protein n=1 Tax=Nocardioides houyundeii TaxID=2045452 RepID=UPI00131537C4|nr:hypothetical protein [Nocardioides houyundeii]